MNPPTGYPAAQNQPNPMLAAYANQQQPFYGGPVPGYPQAMQQTAAVSLPQEAFHHGHPMPTMSSMSLPLQATTGPMMPATSLPGVPANHVSFGMNTTSSPFPPASVPATTATDVSMPPTTQNMTVGMAPQPQLPQQPQPPHQAQQQQQQQSQQQQQQQQQQQRRSQTPAGAAVAAAAVASPQTQAAIARERARIATLLDINSALLQEVIRLQADGKGGAVVNTSPTQQQGGAPTEGQQTPSPEFIDCMRRLQANLGYLASIADRHKKPGGVPPAPAIMTPPPSLPSLKEPYAKLAELFRGAMPAQQQPRPVMTSAPVSAPAPGQVQPQAQVATDNGA